MVTCAWSESFGQQQKIKCSTTAYWPWHRAKCMSAWYLEVLVRERERDKVFWHQLVSKLNHRKPTAREYALSLAFSSWWSWWLKRLSFASSRDILTGLISPLSALMVRMIGCLRKDNDSGFPPFHVGENDASCNPCFPQLVPRIFASSSGDPVFSYKIAHSAFLRHESEGSTLQRTDIIVHEELFSLILFL